VGRIRNSHSPFHYFSIHDIVAHFDANVLEKLSERASIEVPLARCVDVSKGLANRPIPGLEEAFQIMVHVVSVGHGASLTILATPCGLN
jgi:hypothetical protein